MGQRTEGRRNTGNEATRLSKDESMIGSGHWNAKEMRGRKEDKLRIVYEARLDCEGNQDASPCVHCQIHLEKKRFHVACSPARRAGHLYMSLSFSND